MPDKSKLLVIGQKPHGIFIVRTDPARIIHLTDAQIQKYAEDNGKEDGYVELTTSAAANAVRCVRPASV